MIGNTSNENYLSEIFAKSGIKFLIIIIIYNYIYKKLYNFTYLHIENFIVSLNHKRREKCCHT